MANWLQMCTQLNAQEDIGSLAVYNGRLYAGTSNGGRLFRLNLAGNAWEQVCAQLYQSSGLKTVSLRAQNEKC